MPDDWKNKLYFGDNLNILRKLSDEIVDLVYLDPPFNSKANYNILFAEPGGKKSAAQVTAFGDTWHWSEESEHTYHEVVTTGPKRLADLLQAFRSFLGQNDMMAYLTMMAPRLAELHRVLKPTGSIYLHCDPTASHYIKLLMDAVFGPANFRNEIVWRRSQTRSSISRIFRKAHDVILFYGKSDKYVFNLQFKELSQASKKIYSKKDESGIYRLVPLLVSGRRQGFTGKVWRGTDPNVHGQNGMHWITVPEKLEEYDRLGLIVWPQKSDGLPQLKYYLETNKGVPVSDFWDDVDIISSSSNEGLGYPTQKPEALLERFIRAGSNEGYIVLDPFCGCGTAVTVAERLHRRWIGIDITHLAITLIKHRLQNAFGPELSPYEVIGDPKDLASAYALAAQDRYQFEWWALGLVDARPAHDRKKGSDTGIDGYINFFDDESGNAKKIVVQVKSGHVSASHIRDLKGVIEREKAAIGVYLSLEEPTKSMQQEAIGAGYYVPTFYQNQQYPRVQILTIKQLLEGKRVEYPRVAPVATFKKAERQQKGDKPEQGRLL